MNTVDTVVVGAGHAGLAMSTHLTARGRDHVVLDRGRTGERWRSERWDSMRLLTPNWTLRLAGCDYGGPASRGEPNGTGGAALTAGHGNALPGPPPGKTPAPSLEEIDRGSSLA